MSEAFSTEVRAFLERARVGRFATADAGGAPHVVPFVFALVDETICFIVDEKPKTAGKVLKRVRNLIENPRVAIVVDHYEDDWSRLEYVLVRGTASLVEDEYEFGRALEQLRERYPQYHQMRLERGRNPIVRIVPEAIHHWKASGR